MNPNALGRVIELGRKEMEIPSDLAKLRAKLRGIQNNVQINVVYRSPRITDTRYRAGKSRRGRDRRGTGKGERAGRERLLSGTRAERSDSNRSQARPRAKPYPVQ